MSKSWTPVNQVQQEQMPPAPKPAFTMQPGQQNPPVQAQQKHPHADQELLLPNYHDETPAGTLLRGAARHTSGAFNQVAGSAGGLLSLPVTASHYLSGGKTPTYEKLREDLPYLPPTASELDWSTAKATSGYTLPQNAAEKKITDFTNTIASLAGPGKVKLFTAKNLARIMPEPVANFVGNLLSGFAGKGMTPKRALATAALGEGVEKGAQMVGLPMPIQKAARFGSMILSSLPGVSKKLDTRMEDLYKQAKEVIRPKGVITTDNYLDMTHLRNKLAEFRTKAESSNAPNKDILLGIINGTEDSLNSYSGTKGKGDNANLVLASDALQLKQDTNKWVKLASRPTVPKETYLPTDLRADVIDILDAINEPLQKFGQTKNKEFGRVFNQAEDLFKGFYDHDTATQFLKDHVNLKGAFASDLTKLGLFGGIGWQYGLPAAGGLLGAIWATKEGRLIRNLVEKSTVAKKAYVDAFVDASQNNLSGFMRHATTFDKQAIKTYGNLKI